jgi:hypothetical protein
MSYSAATRIAVLGSSQRFFEDPADDSLAEDLDDIFFAAYTQPDVEAVIEEVREAFSPEGELPTRLSPRDARRQ